jgi:pyroglutamyl-peptidase
VSRALVIGFGAFGEVIDNPARRLALGVDGLAFDDLQIIGREMPVSYRRCLDETAAQIEAVRPDLLLGVGVARGRGAAMVEGRGLLRLDPLLADVDGERRGAVSAEGPLEIAASAGSLALAEAMGLVVSLDAGSYVCNAWLYEAARRFGTELPVAFLHIPDQGLPVSTLCSGLGAWWREERARAASRLES